MHHVLYTNAFRLALAALAALAAACSTPPTKPEPAPPAAAAEPVLPAVDQTRIDALLAAAERALAEQRLLTPADDNAHGYYAQVLELIPDQPDATRGFERIVDAYLVLARRAVAQERWAGARSMLDRAALVDDAHPGIAPLRRQVEMLASAERMALSLDRAALRQRRADVAAQLAAFGRNARRPNARVTIRAGSDADGRWIYEQLNNAPGERRIRGGIEIGVPPKVTILLLPTSAVSGQRG